MSKEELREGILELMEVFGTTVTFISKKVDYDKGYVSRFIHNKISPSADTSNLERALEKWYIDTINSFKNEISK